MADFKSDLLVIIMLGIFILGIAWLSYHSHKTPRDTPSQDSPSQKTKK